MDTPEGLFFSSQPVTPASEPEEAGATLAQGERWGFQCVGAQSRAVRWHIGLEGGGYDWQPLTCGLQLYWDSRSIAGSVGEGLTEAGVSSCPMEVLQGPDRGGCPPLPQPPVSLGAAAQPGLLPN